ncbi:MAG: cytochrome c biogenesis CcdA family protein [Promethearchaeota archaeon]
MKITRNINQISLLLTIFAILGFSLVFSLSTVNAQTSQINIDDQISLEYYSLKGCSICLEKEQYIDELKINHPTINLTKYIIVVEENFSEYLDYTDSLGLGKPTPPLAIFRKGDCVYGLVGEDITLNSLEQWYETFEKLEGVCPDWQGKDITPWFAFVSGLITGLSPCVILVTAVISSALIVQEGKKTKLLPLFTGFTLGVLLMYFLLGMVVVFTFGFLGSTFFGTTIRIIFAVIMILLGLWYIIDAYNEKSKLFSTPEPIKKFVRNMADKGTFLYSFILGFVFSFLKIPCVGGIMISLIYGISNNPALYVPSLILFYTGLLIPLVILMVILGIGVQTEKINQMRMKYRPALRIVSGLLIIGLTIYSLLN